MCAASTELPRNISLRLRGRGNGNKHEEIIKSITYDEVVNAMKKLSVDKWSIVATSPIKIPNSFEESDDESEVSIITSNKAVAGFEDITFMNY